MKSMLVIGLGKFGHHLCHNLVDLGNEVMIVDMREDVMEDLLPIVTSAKIGDCTNPDVLGSLGVGNFDVCFVCIGTNFQSNLEITDMLREMGAKYIVSKANRDIHAKFLMKNGADEVVYPDRDICDRIAMKHTDNNIFDYIEIDDEFSIYEIPTKAEWIGRTIREVDFRARYSLNIIGIRRNGKTKAISSAEHVFKEDEHLIVMCTKDEIGKLLKQYK